LDRGADRRMRGETRRRAEKNHSAFEGNSESEKEGLSAGENCYRRAGGNEKRARFEIIFAREQSEETQKKLEKKLAARLDAVEDAEMKIDPSLIGGFVAATDKYLVDASVKGQIEKLKKFKV